MLAPAVFMIAVLLLAKFAPGSISICRAEARYSLDTSQHLFLQGSERYLPLSGTQSYIVYGFFASALWGA